MFIKGNLVVSALFQSILNTLVVYVTIILEKLATRYENNFRVKYVKNCKERL